MDETLSVHSSQVVRFVPGGSSTNVLQHMYSFAMLHGNKTYVCHLKLPLLKSREPLECLKSSNHVADFKKPKVPLYCQESRLAALSC